VWWVHCTGKVYRGTILEIELCEYQGALYCLLDSPSFRVNRTPIIHYSDVFKTLEEAKEFAEYQTKNPDGVYPRCMGCHYNYSRHAKKEAT
jgi:hypothetical protein